jgi:hypothetical protein
MSWNFFPNFESFLHYQLININSIFLKTIYIMDINLDDNELYANVLNNVEHLCGSRVCGDDKINYRKMGMDHKKMGMDHKKMGKCLFEVG